MYVIVNCDLNVLNQVEYRYWPRQLFRRRLAYQGLVKVRYSPDRRRRLIPVHWNFRISCRQYTAELVLLRQPRHSQRVPNVSLLLILVGETNGRVYFEILRSRMFRSPLVN